MITAMIPIPRSGLNISKVVLWGASLGILGGAMVGCKDSPAIPSPSAAKQDNEVVVYTALDRAFSEPLLNDFARQTGIKVLPVYDTESTKTIGLVNRIRSESGRPRCDVFWNNEILNTLQLKSEGLLQPCRPGEAENYPAEFRDPDGCWYGFAARARVFLVNTSLVPTTNQPGSIYDLANAHWQGRAGIAKPLFGSTASHVACLFAQLGNEPARRLLAAIKANQIQILSGNKACAEMVGRGELAWALTDTDDAVSEMDSGKPVRIVFPDTKAITTTTPAMPPMGTLLLPNTLSVIKGAPHPEAAQRLIDYLLSAKVEARLAFGESAQIPLHRYTPAVSRVCQDRSALRWMDVDFATAANKFSDAARFIEQEFLR